MKPTIFQSFDEIREAVKCKYIPKDYGYNEKEARNSLPTLMWMRDTNCIAHQPNQDSAWSNPQFLKILQQSVNWSDIREEHVKSEFEINYTYTYSYQTNIERSSYDLRCIAKKRTIQADSLEELAMWLDPKWVADWSTFDQDKCMVSYAYTHKIFRVSTSTALKMAGAVYMSYSICSKIVTALNSGKLPELAEKLKG